MNLKNGSLALFLVLGNFVSTSVYSKSPPSDLAAEIRKIDLTGPVKALEKTPIQLKFKKEFTLENKVDGLVPETEIPLREFVLELKNESINCTFKVSGNDVYSWDAVRFNPQSIFTGNGASVIKNNRVRFYDDTSRRSEMMGTQIRIVDSNEKLNGLDEKDIDDLFSQNVSVQFNLNNKKGVILKLSCDYVEKFIVPTEKIEIISYFAYHWDKEKSALACRAKGGTSVSISSDPNNQFQYAVTCKGLWAKAPKPVRLTYQLIRDFLTSHGIIIEIPESKKIDVRVAEGYQTPAG